MPTRAGLCSGCSDGVVVVGRGYWGLDVLRCRVGAVDVVGDMEEWWAGWYCLHFLVGR